MKLFFHIPEGHGSASFFVLADSAEAAASAVNATRRAELDSARYPDPLYWHRHDLRAEDFQAAEVGQVIDHPNE